MRRLENERCKKLQGNSRASWWKCFVAAFFVVSMAVCGHSRAQAATLTQTFDDPTPTSGDEFGFSVAIDGNRILIAADKDDTNGTNVGQVHLFDATTGTPLHTFNDPTPTSTFGGDMFGHSVALDGNLVLIGAPGDDTTSPNNGQAYLFNVTTGALLHTFNGPNTSFANFGHTVALDGNKLLIGGSNLNEAHLFDATTGMLLETFNDPTGGGHFRAVALDGNNVLIGSHNDNTNGPGVGQAYLFNATTGALVHTFDDPTPTSFESGDRFGQSVALDGNLVLIGAPTDDTNGNNVGQAHLFDATTGMLLETFNDPTVTVEDWFGIRVALDGNKVLIGAYQDDTNGTNVGQAHLFDATTGMLLETFNDPTVTTTDLFGGSVALQGNNILIGAFRDDTNGTNVGQVHLFDNASTTVPTGPDSGGSTGGGSGTIGGVDFTFDEVTTGGLFTGDYTQPADQAELDAALGAIAAGLIDFQLPTDPLQLWELDFTGEFTGDVTLQFGYDDTGLLPQEEAQLRIQHFVDGAWTTPQQQVFINQNIIEVTVDSFSPMLLSIVPEPSTCAIGLMGLLSLSCHDRRRRKR